jgi:type IV pilus assembly protein PilO
MAKFSLKSVNLKSPQVIARALLGVLLAVNLVTALVVFKPWAGSLEDLEREAAGLRQEVARRQAAIARLAGIVRKVEGARADGDRFMESYLLSKRTVSSTLLGELEQTARKAGIKLKEIKLDYEPLEGTEAISKAVITASYDGTYADLMQFVNLLDRSERLLIVESLSAAPQQAGLALGVTMKLNTFVWAGGAAPEPAVTSGAATVERAAVR